MEHNSEAYFGLNVSKSRNAVAVANGGREGEVRYLGEIDNSPEATRKLVAKLTAKYDRLHFCYAAGPTGYGLHRWLTGLGHACTVVAPLLIPQRPRDRVKTNRCDAQGLAKLLRAGELTAVWVPDGAHEAVRDLVRARAATVRDVRGKRWQVTGFLLRHGRSYPGKAAWGARHHCWQAEQNMDHRAQQIALAEMISAVRDVETRQERLEQYLCGLSRNGRSARWSMRCRPRAASASWRQSPSWLKLATCRDLQRHGNRWDILASYLRNGRPKIVSGVAELPRLGTPPPEPCSSRAHGATSTHPGLVSRRSMSLTSCQRPLRKLRGKRNRGCAAGIER